MVEEGEADVKAGRVYSHQEVIKHFKDKRGRKEISFGQLKP